MLALYRAGRQADALEVLNDTRTALDEELGLAPSPHLQRLQAAILRQEPALEVSTKTTTRREAPEPDEAALGGAKDGDRDDGAPPEHPRLGSRGAQPRGQALRRARDADRGALRGRIASSLGDEVMAVFGVPHAHEDDAFRAVSAAFEIRDSPVGDAIASGTNPRHRDRYRRGLGERFRRRGALRDRRPRNRGRRPRERSDGRGGADRRRDRTADSRTVDGRAHRDCRRAAPPRSRGEARATDHWLVDGAAGRPRIRAWPAPRGVHGRTRTSPCTCARFWGRQGSASRGSPRSSPRRPRSRRRSSSAAACRTARASPSGPSARSSLSSRPPSRSPKGTRPSASPRASWRGSAARRPRSSARRSSGPREAYSRRLARARPLLVFFEDVHWAEPTFLDLVEYLAERTRGVPIMLVCIARPELLEQRAEWSREQPNASSLRLEPLPDLDCEALIGNLARRLAQESRVRVLETAEGNPLFIEQLVAHAGGGGSRRPEPLDPADDRRAAVGTPGPARAWRAGGDLPRRDRRQGVLRRGHARSAARGRPRLRHPPPGDAGEQGVHRSASPPGRAPAFASVTSSSSRRPTGRPRRPCGRSFTSTSPPGSRIPPDAESPSIPRSSGITSSRRFVPGRAGAVGEQELELAHRAGDHLASAG